MQGKLRKRFTNTEILLADEKAKGNAKKAAKILTDYGRGTVSRQLFRYWVRHLDLKKKNGEPYVGTTVLDRQIREEIEVRNPSRQDDERTDPPPTQPIGSNCILVIPDLHAPYHHPDALDFLIAVAAKYQPDRVINLGDETDCHALSMHDSDPSLDAAGPELERAREFLDKLAKVFPVMDICHSNHGSLVYRRALKSGIPVQYIKSYRDILFPEGGGDGWAWLEQIKFQLPNGDNVLFQHQSSGDILNNAAHERANLVQGHEHGIFDIQYRASSTALYWAMTCGCLVDRKALAFAYGKNFPKKPILGCGVIKNSLPQLIPMVLDSDGRWVGHLGD